MTTTDQPKGKRGVMKEDEVRVVSLRLIRRVSTILLCAAAFALFQIATAPNALADPILGSNLSTFALLGGAGVTVAGTGSAITGSVGGCCNAVSVTGYPAGFTDSGGTVFDTSYPGSLPAGIETAAQSELGTAITALSGMTVNTSESTLDGKTLGPGVYSVSATNFNTTLTLDGYGNANALWVFLVASSLTTASSSVVNVIDTGAGAGVYWVMATGSATLGSGSTFEGNVLAYAAITANTTATDSCGRLLTQTASVSLDGTNTIGIGGCSDTLAGSNGLSGGGTLSFGPTGAPVITPLEDSRIPEPGTFMLLGAGIAYLVARRRRFGAGAAGAKGEGAKGSA